MAAVLCWAIVSTAGCTALYLQERSDHQAIHQAQTAADQANKAVQLVHITQYQLCHRINVHRDNDNINEYANWKVNVLFAAALAHPLRDAPPQTPDQQQLTKRFLVLLQGSVDAQAWTPLTPNCHNPGAGMAPVRFANRQPIKRDLILRPGE